MDTTVTRRNWLLNFGTAAASCTLLPSLGRSAQAGTGSIGWGIALVPEISETLAYSIDIQSEGLVFLGSAEDPKQVPFTVTCKQKYAERLIVRDAIRLASRRYQQGDLVKKFGALEAETVSLGKTPLELIAFPESVDSGRLEFRSAETQLSEKQISLLQVPLSPIWLDELATQVFAGKTKLQVGEKVAISAELAKKLFCLEEVTATTLVCETEKANDSQAVLKISGDVEGRNLDVKTNFRLNSSIRAIFATGKFTQLRASYFEQRAKGTVTPAFQATTKLKIDESEVGTPISNSTIKKHLELPESAAILSFNSDTNMIQLQHGNQWHLLLDQKGAIIWRMISSGEPLTQCNLLLPATKATESVSLNEFVEKVGESLADNDISIDSQQKLQGINGAEILRVQATGKEAGVDLTWIYYYITTSDGRRAQMVFTTDSSFLPALGNADQMMAQTLVFNDDQVASNQAKNLK